MSLASGVAGFWSAAIWACGFTEMETREFTGEVSVSCGHATALSVSTPGMTCGLSMISA